MKIFFSFLIAAIIGVKGYELFFADKASGSSSVTLYSTSWCGYCKKARQLFKEHNIDYTEYNVEKTAIGRQQYQKLGGGVPIVVIGDNIIRGYDKRRILALAK